MNSLFSHFPFRLAALAGVLAFSTEFEALGERPDFNREIRPILSDKCFFCHGPDAHDRKADLRLDTVVGAIADLGGYAAIVPGKPGESELIARILATDPDERMPPHDSHKTLTGDEIAILERWVESGAKFDAPWAYVPPAEHPLPVVKDSAWPRNPVDHFLLARLEAEGLAPSSDADPITLMRRLHFDLTGLPPTPEKVDAFLNHEGDFESAWSRLVEELLESPHFGERLAVYWLDLVRYADTVGYHGDQDHNISPYRDWVIEAFHSGMPFDQFTLEQLAGDLLPGPTSAQKVASGYNRLLQTSHEGGIQKGEYDAIYAADRVRNLSVVWMGATLGCAQCHDHKYDPFTIRDFYAMAAFFGDIHDDGFGGNKLPALRPPEMTLYTPAQEAAILERKRELEKLLPNEIRVRIEELETTLRETEAKAKTAKKPEVKSQLDSKIAELGKSLSESASEESLRKRREILSTLSALEAVGRPTMITVAKPPRETRVLARGDWQDESGEVVTPSVPDFLGRIAGGEEGRATRLDLAHWLTDTEKGAGGLTARVFANRFWYLFFGEGISRSLEDFGGQGEPPSHPELLDFVSLHFVRNGYDVRDLVRLLVTSRAYRQSSVPDPEQVLLDPANRLFSRQSRFRLPAEFVRDNALAISGLLVVAEGGDSVKPYQPDGYYRHLNFPKREYETHLDERLWRRGVYMHWQRMFLHPMLKAMDAPSREECTAERPRSNTPNAALVLLNDPTFVEAARVFAARILTEGGTTEAKFDRAAKLALSRPLDEEELQLLTSLLTKTRAEYESDPAAATALLGNGIAPVPPALDPVELASWTAVGRALLNLSETTTRN